MKRLLFLILLLIPSLVFAQGTTSYAWQSGDLALTYPADWQEPQEIEGRLILRATEDDLPGVPTIALSRTTTTSSDLYTQLQNSFNESGIIPTGPLDAELIGFSAVSTSGTSIDGTLYAVGRIARLADATTVQIIGTVATTEREAFLVVFNAVADSISLGASSTPRISSDYGVLWQASSADGDPFTYVAGLAYAADGTLYVVDTQLGIIRIDAATGGVQEILRPEIVVAPSDIAVADDGTIYVSDLACSCIVILSAAGDENGTVGGLNARDNLNITLTSNGRIFAADDDGITANGRVITAAQANSLLALDNAGAVLVLSPDGSVGRLQDDSLTPLIQLNNLPPITDFIVDANNHLFLATATQGILIYDLNGQQIGQLGRVVPSFPLPGELVSPTAVAVSPDGTVFWADSGAITAMSANVQSGTSGTGVLTFGLAVQGILNEFTPTQTWTFEGTAGQIITLTAIDSSPDNPLDVALRLLSPMGSEEAFNDDNATGDLPARSDAQIFAHTLQASGTYFALVERVNGEGGYILGLSEGVQNFDLNRDEATTLQGELQAVFPIQRWAFNGFAGQVFTVTMIAESGDLDPLLRLRDVNGNVLAENDDAADPALGLNAQLLQVVLPSDGPYTLEAVRFAGTGRYRIIIVATSQ